MKGIEKSQTTDIQIKL